MTHPAPDRQARVARLVQLIDGLHRQHAAVATATRQLLAEGLVSAGELAVMHQRAHAAAAAPAAAVPIPATATTAAVATAA
jgi:hypothetical protein